LQEIKKSHRFDLLLAFLFLYFFRSPYTRKTQHYSRWNEKRSIEGVDAFSAQMTTDAELNEHECIHHNIESSLKSRLSKVEPPPSRRQTRGTTTFGVSPKKEENSTPNLSLDFFFFNLVCFPKPLRIFTHKEFINTTSDSRACFSQGQIIQLDLFPGTTQYSCLSVDVLSSDLRNFLTYTVVPALVEVSFLYCIFC
jgi:hypothetical protein